MQPYYKHRAIVPIPTLPIARTLPIPQRRALAFTPIEPYLLEIYVQNQSWHASTSVNTSDITGTEDIVAVICSPQSNTYTVGFEALQIGFLRC